MKKNSIMNSLIKWINDFDFICNSLCNETEIVLIIPNILIFRGGVKTKKNQNSTVLSELNIS